MVGFQHEGRADLSAEQVRPDTSVDPDMSSISSRFVLHSSYLPEPIWGFKLFIFDVY